MTTKIFRSWGPFAFLVVLVAYFSFSNSHFATVSNLFNILIQIVPVVIGVAAVTLLMVSGSLDLSVGGVLALSGVTAALLSAAGLPVTIAFIGGIAIGLVVGGINGVLVVFLGINPVIATLGTAYAATGAAWLLTGDSAAVAPGNDGFFVLGTARVVGIPWIVIVMVVVVAIFVVLEKLTLVGKYSVAVGSNFEGARLSGIRVNGFRVLLFILASIACGIAGILYASQLTSGQPSIGTGFEFSIIVAAVVGGVSLSGGRGTVIGSVVGAAIIGVIHVALNENFVNSFWQQIIEGVLLVGVVALDSLLQEAIPRPSWLTFSRKAV